MRLLQRFLDPTRPDAWLLFVPFGLLNATVAGIASIAIPLFAGTPQLAGLATALLNVGLAVGAPLAVWLAQSAGQKPVLIGSLIGAGLTFLLLAAPTTPLFLGATLLFGLCASAGLTLSTLFVMGWYPRPQWDTQIGWLQTVMGVGQVVGLLVTVVVLNRLGLSLMGLGLALAAGLFALLLPAPTSSTPALPPVHVRQPAHAPPISVGGGIGLHHLAAFAPARWPIFRARALYPFFWQWGLAMIGGGPIFAVYPLLMHHQFGLTQSQSAWGFAIAALVGIGLYEPAGRWAQRVGSSQVLGWSYGVRAVGLLLIAVACWTHATGWWAIVGFGIVVLSWSALTVASNTRITEVSRGDAGAELGALYALTTIAKVVGSLIGGLVIVSLGYGGTMFVSSVLLLVAAVWALRTLPPTTLMTPPRRTAPSDTPSSTP